MNWRAWLRRKLCPACVERAPASRTEPVIGVMERSAEALDRIAREFELIRREAANKPNPILGPSPPPRQRVVHVQRKERPR